MAPKNISPTNPFTFNNDGFTITDDLPEWDQFLSKIKEIFPSIPHDWEVEIIAPPFASSYRTIYTRANS